MTQYGIWGNLNLFSQAWSLKFGSKITVSYFLLRLELCFWFFLVASVGTDSEKNVHLRGSS